MKDQLIRYVDLLFAGAENAADIKQEILHNTLDRYDDLISQGKTPQAAYSLSIAGIGDVSELLGSIPAEKSVSTPDAQSKPAQHTKPLWKKVLLAAAIFLYVISIIPLIILSELGMDSLGLCATVSIVAVATVAIILSSSGSKQPKEEKNVPMTPQQEMAKAINKAISTVGLVIYFLISFLSGAWHITWLIFPMMAAAEGIVKACLDLKEAKEHEN